VFTRGVTMGIPKMAFFARRPLANINDLKPRVRGQGATSRILPKYAASGSLGHLRTATGTSGSVSRARFHVFARACRVTALQGEAPKASRSGHDERRPARVLACLATRAGSIRAIRTVQLETTGRFGNAASQHAVPPTGGKGPKKQPQAEPTETGGGAPRIVERPKCSP
jgi:hypothetical protein